MIVVKELTYFTSEYNEMIPIKREVAKIVEES